METFRCERVPRTSCDSAQVTVPDRGRRLAHSFLACPDLCPSCPLSCCNSLASGNRNRSLFVRRCGARFAPLHVDFPKGSEGGAYAVQFILKSCAFLLELADYGLHQCFWHESILSLRIWGQDGSCGKSWCKEAVSLMTADRIIYPSQNQRFRVQTHGSAAQGLSSPCSGAELALWVTHHLAAILPRPKTRALSTVSCYSDVVKRLLQFRSSLRFSPSRLSY